MIISIQNWLSESPEQSKNAATPSYMSVFMSCKRDREQPRQHSHDPCTNSALLFSDVSGRRTLALPSLIHDWPIF